MVQTHEFGVGLGQWQVHYPVFRLHQRSRSFDETFQVRRAHSDHVQVLGETGWLGLGLWLLWLGSLFWSALGNYVRNGSTWSLWVAAQVVVWGVAMAGDYVIEMPYHKFQFFLVAFLATQCGLGTPSVAELDPPAAEGRDSRQMARAIRWALGALLLGGYCTLSWEKFDLSAELQHRHATVVAELRTSGRAEVADLETIQDLGERFVHQPGISKTFHRDFLALGHTAFLLGDSAQARQFVGQALDLHPYSPKALRLMAQVVPPSESESWHRAYRYVMDEATRGFERPYPDPSLDPTSDHTEP